MVHIGYCFVIVLSLLPFPALKEAGFSQQVQDSKCCDSAVSKHKNKSKVLKKARYRYWSMMEEHFLFSRSFHSRNHKFHVTRERNLS